MAESFGIGESVTVEVTRAGGLRFDTTGSAALGAFETLAIFVGIVAVLAVVGFLVRRHMRQTGAVRGPSRRNDLVRSLAISAVMGFAGFLLSASPYSWVLSAGIFYHQFFYKRSRA